MAEDREYTQRELLFAQRYGMSRKTLDKVLATPELDPAEVLARFRERLLKPKKKAQTRQ